MQLLVRVASALAASALVVAATVPPAQASVRRVPAPDYSVNPATHPNEYENRIVARINEARARAGLKQLRVFQSCLDGHAERWAKHLAESGRLEHRNQQQCPERVQPPLDRRDPGPGGRRPQPARDGPGLDALARPPRRADEAARQPRRRRDPT